jgi:4-aminobutyrate aminotransferase-like enzyme
VSYNINALPNDQAATARVGKMPALLQIMTITTNQSQAIFEQARRVMPGGVSSMNRLAEPNLVFVRADGAYIFDAEGRRYKEINS